MAQVQVLSGFYRLSIKALMLNPSGTKFLIIQGPDGRWDFPGGALEFGETVQECLRREVSEEMGLEVVYVIDHPAYFLVDQLQSEAVRGTWYANVFYEVGVSHLNITPSPECVAFKFVSPEEVNYLDVYNSVEKFAKMFKPRLVF